MTLFISLIISYFIYKLDTFSSKIIFISTSLTLILFSISFEIRNTPYVKRNFLVFDNIKMEWSFYFFFLSIIAGLFLGFWFSEKFTINFQIKKKSYNEKYIQFFYYSMFVISFTAFIINLVRVKNVLLLFVSPRQYEFIFGKYTFINYLYFLNVPALILSVFYKLKFNKRIQMSKILNFILILESFFHGIKFYYICFIHIRVFHSLD